MTSQPLKHSRGNRKTVIIGFDFGTHSTKVVFRERGKADGHIARFDEAAKGYPFRASPSLVRCVDDRLYFGTEALSTSGGVLFRSLKVRLHGLQQSNISFSEGLNCETLVAAYFAWAFQQLRRSLSECADSNMFLNVAAPMSHFENPELKTRYLQIIQAAWNVSFVEQATPIHQGILSSEVARILAPMLEEPVLGSELRRFDVLPETIAPVVSLSLDPWMKPGMYMIVDTGAGTTEMSVFHAGEPGADQKVSCYRDETMLLGGADLNLAERSKDDDRCLKLNEIFLQMEKLYRRLWQEGYQIINGNHHARRRWSELTLVLSGGGTRHPRLAELLSKVNPMLAWPEKETRLSCRRHVPGTLELGENMDDGSLFAVANGLAIERKHWPIIFPPNQIEPLEPTQKVDNKPLGYWYPD